MKANMKKGRKETSLFLIMFLISLNQYAQDSVIDTLNSHIYTEKQLNLYWKNLLASKVIGQTNQDL